jgi:circadian clock protein KaiC
MLVVWVYNPESEQSVCNNRGEADQMKCPACRRENTADSSYCFYCGTALFTRPEKPKQAEIAIPIPGGKTTIANRLQRSPTGIEGLDVMISGGFPKGRVVLISGGPGTGKTTMSLQFLVNGCMKFGENGIFISLDEPLKKLVQETSEFGWDLKRLTDENKLGFIESSTLRKFSAEELTAQIMDVASKISAQRICLDPLTFVSIHYPDIVARRKVIMNLFETLTATGATSIVTNESRGDTERAILLEEYLADAVLRLTSSRVDRGRVRTIEIEKMRGTVIDDQARPYVIENDGIKVISQSDLFTYAASIFSKKMTEKTGKT